MKSTLFVLALTAAPAVFGGEAPVSAPAPAPVVSSPAPAKSGWFLGAKGSALWVDDIGYTVDTAFGDVGLNASYDVGWGVTMPFGYRFDSGFSLGSSVGYYSADVDDLTVKWKGDTLGNLDIDADPSMVPILANAAYSFNLTESLSMTLGAGIGVAWSEFDVDRIAGIDYDFSTDGWNLSFQAFGGFNYTVTPNTDLTLGYRYVQTETDEDSIQGHNVEAGFVIRF